MVMQGEEGQDVAGELAPHELRALQALASADAALSAERPWQGAADDYERLAREAREREPDTARPARAAPPSRVAPSPSPAAADDGEAPFLARPVRMGVMTRVLSQLVNEERERAAKTIGELERRIEALEARASGETKKGKRK